MGQPVLACAIALPLHVAPWLALNEVYARTFILICADLYVQT